MNARDEHEHGWREIGSYAPLNADYRAVGGTDRGAGGSLRQEARRHRQLRSLQRSRLRRATERLTPAAAVVAAATTILTTLLPVSLAVTMLTALLLIVACGASAALWAPDAAERALYRQAHLERRVARRLRVLEGWGWTLLPDRRLPGGEHRVPLVLVGPAGIVLIAPLPVRGCWTVHDRHLHIGDQPMNTWFTARRWETDHLARAVPPTLGQWHDYPVTTMAIVHPGTVVARLLRWIRPAKTSRTGGEPPAHWMHVPVRRLDSAPGAVRALVAPLPRLVTAQLVAATEEICPPAAAADL